MPFDDGKFCSNQTFIQWFPQPMQFAVFKQMGEMFTYHVVSPCQKIPAARYHLNAASYKIIIIYIINRFNPVVFNT